MFNQSDQEIAGWQMPPSHDRRSGRFAGLEELFVYLPRIMHVLRPHWKLMLLSIITLLLAVLIGLLTPWPLTILIDSVLGNLPLPAVLVPLARPLVNSRVSLLLAVIAAEVAIKLLGNLVSVIQTYANTKLELQVDFDFRSELFEHAEHLSLPFYERTSSGGLAVGLTYESKAAGSLVMNLLPIVQSILTLVGMVWVSFQLDRSLTLLSLLVVPFLYYSVGYYATHIRDRLSAARGLAGQAVLVLHESLRMFRVILAFGREEHEYSRYRTLAEKLNAINTDVAVREALLSIVVNMATAVGTALVLGLGAYHVLNKELTTGQLLVLLSYVAAVYLPLQTLSNKVAYLQNLYLSLRLGFHIRDTQPEIQDAPGALALERARRAVRFEEVSFDYPGRRGTLQRLSFEAQPGQVIALVGPTGAGKTTLLSLLPRFYDPSAGRVLLDDHDLRTLTLESLRSQISVVLQEPLLFSGSIADNIRYGRLDASREELVAAAQAANAHEFIQKLPQAYDTRIGEKGASLSGGERQRIAVARAFLRQAPLLLLDEPTSSIDSKTESVILDALDRLMEGRTTFIAAHRLSTIRHADLILVLDRGELVEQGTHEELLARRGLYYDLYRMQTQSRTRRSPNGHDGKAAEIAPADVRSNSTDPDGRVPRSSQDRAERKERNVNLSHEKKIVILGMMSKMPVAGIVYLITQYLVGLKRLGYDAYYVEAHAGTPSMLYENQADDGSARAARFIADAMRRVGLQGKWAFHALHDDGACYGMTLDELNELYRSAELIINLHGGTTPLPEHYATDRLVYVGTDPVEVEIQLAEGEERTIRNLEPHCAFFTWGENYGNPDCRVPYSERFHFIPTRQPILLDWWQSDGPRDGREPDAFTTIGNWRQPWRVLTFQGETYYWSKHFEFLKFVDLPTHTNQAFELALSNCGPEDRALLERNRWRVREALSLSGNPDTYRNYILNSRGEFTVAKDQNVRLRSGWFSDRSACYLAAGRPVITQETGFGNILPTGDGLFGFSTEEDILAAVDAINSNYSAHSRAAFEIARECFSYDVVLPKMIEAIGAERARASTLRSRTSALATRDPAHDSTGGRSFRVKLEAAPPGVMDAGSQIEVECGIQNLGSAVLASTPPNPIHVSYKWLDPETGQPLPGIEGIRTAFPHAVAAGDHIQLPVRLQAPSTAGKYELRVTVVQERVAWFDDLDARNALSVPILVRVPSEVRTESAEKMSPSGKAA